MGRLFKLLLIGLGGSAAIILLAVLLTPLPDPEEDSGETPVAQPVTEGQRPPKHSVRQT